MLSSETMMSICKTLETIDFCCRRNAYSDGYTLIRKFRDDLMQYLFILNVIRDKQEFVDKEIEEFMEDAESIIKMLELDAFVSGEKKTNSELAIEKWIYSELENPSNAKDSLQIKSQG